MLSHLPLDLKLEILQYFKPCEIVNPKNIGSFRSCIYENQLEIDFQDVPDYTFYDIENKYTLLELFHLVSRTNWNLFIKIDDQAHIRHDNPLFMWCENAAEIKKKRNILNALAAIKKQTNRTIKIVVADPTRFPENIECINSIFVKQAVTNNPHKLECEFNIKSLYMKTDHIDDVKIVALEMGWGNIDTRPQVMIKSSKNNMHDNIFNLFNFNILLKNAPLSESKLYIKDTNFVANKYELYLEYLNNVTTEGQEELIRQAQSKECNITVFTGNNVISETITFNHPSDNVCIAAPPNSILKAELYFNGFLASSMSGEEMWNNENSNCNYNNVYSLTIPKTTFTEYTLEHFRRFYKQGTFCFSRIDTVRINIFFAQTVPVPSYFTLFTESYNIQRYYDRMTGPVYSN